jgi:hypothetical protein
MEKPTRVSSVRSSEADESLAAALKVMGHTSGLELAAAVMISATCWWSTETGNTKWRVKIVG